LRRGAWEPGEGVGDLLGAACGEGLGRGGGEGEGVEGVAKAAGVEVGGGEVDVAEVALKFAFEQGVFDEVFAFGVGDGLGVGDAVAEDAVAGLGDHGVGAGEDVGEADEVAVDGVEVSASGPGEGLDGEEFGIGEGFDLGEGVVVPVEGGKGKQNPALGGVGAAEAGEVVAAGAAGAGEQGDVDVAAEDGHVGGEGQLEEELGVAVAFGEGVDHGLPAGIAGDERPVDPVPGEVADGEGGQAGFGGGFEGDGGDVGDDEIGAFGAEELGFFVDEGGAVFEQVERFAQGGVDVDADGILLDHADVEGAGAEGEAASGVRQAASQEGFGKIGGDGDARGGMTREEGAEDVARADAVSVAVGGDVVGDVHGGQVYTGEGERENVKLLNPYHLGALRFPKASAKPSGAQKSPKGVSPVI
jgi:hypothetical protein